MYFDLNNKTLQWNFLDDVWERDCIRNIIFIIYFNFNGKTTGIHSWTVMIKMWLLCGDKDGR